MCPLLGAWQTYIRYIGSLPLGMTNRRCPCCWWCSSYSICGLVYLKILILIIENQSQLVPGDYAVDRNMTTLPPISLSLSLPVHIPNDDEYNCFTLATVDRQTGQATLIVPGSLCCGWDGSIEHKRNWFGRSLIESKTTTHSHPAPAKNNDQWIWWLWQTLGFAHNPPPAIQHAAAAEEGDNFRPINVEHKAAEITPNWLFRNIQKWGH